MLNMGTSITSKNLSILTHKYPSSHSIILLNRSSTFSSSSSHGDGPHTHYFVFSFPFRPLPLSPHHCSPSVFVRTTFSGLKYQRPVRLRSRPVFSAPWSFSGTTNLEDNNDEEIKKMRVEMIDVPPVFKDRVRNILKELEAIAKSDAINQRDYDDIADRMVVLFQEIVDYVDNRRKERKIVDFFMHPLVGIFTVSILCFILCFFCSRLAGSSKRRLLGCCFCISWLMSRVSKILSI